MGRRAASWSSPIARCQLRIASAMKGKAIKWRFRRWTAGASESPRRPRESRNFFLQAEDGIRDSSVTGVQTCALPICTIGNNSPIMSRREFWFSPQLGVNLISKLQHPLSGTQDFEVSDIALGEPDAKLF